VGIFLVKDCSISWSMRAKYRLEAYASVRTQELKDSRMQERCDVDLGARLSVLLGCSSA
jgi:hypothetical protein